MNNLCETLLYISNNLVKQNQVISLEGFQRALGEEQEKISRLPIELEWLLSNGYLERLSDQEFILTALGNSQSAEISKNRTKEDFQRLICSGVKSLAYLDYCEEIYGYRMPLFNMMDKMQLDYVFHEISISPSDTVLDIGCGTGCILNHLINKYHCKGIGVDCIEERILTESGKSFAYIEDDYDTLPEKILTPNISLSIDSLYFSNDLRGLLHFLQQVNGNRLYLFFSQYIFDERNRNAVKLSADNTRLAMVLHDLEIAYKFKDFSENEFSLYLKGLDVLPKYKHSFEAEGNTDLYQKTLKGNKTGKDLYDKGLASRFLYIVEG